MGYTQELADFASGTKFEDLPASVVDYTKLVFLDTLVCGIAAKEFERSRMLQSVASQMGGPPESTAYGLPTRVSAVAASMANCEMTNFLDADDTFFSSNHFGAFSVTAALAMGERCHKPGRDVILATALGFEVNAHVNLSLKWMDFIDGQFRWSDVSGMGFAAFGAMVSAGVLLGLNQEQMRNAFGLTGWMAPGPGGGRSIKGQQFYSQKYGPYTTPTLAGVLAAMFAQQGYVGEQHTLDGPDGFWKTQSSVSTDQGLLTWELGNKWWIEETSIKFYPSCRYTAAPLDMLYKLMAEENLTADEIENIDVALNPMAFTIPMFRNPAKKIDGGDHRAPLNAQFNIPYVLAVAMLGYRPGPGWHRKERFDDPKVIAFMERVTTSQDPAAAAEAMRAFREERIGRFRKGGGAIKVRARGQEYTRSTDFCFGDPWTPDTLCTWERLDVKIHNFLDDLLTPAQIERLTHDCRHLEDMNDVSHLLDFMVEA